MSAVEGKAVSSQVVDGDYWGVSAREGELGWRGRSRGGSVGLVVLLI